MKREAHHVLFLKRMWTVHDPAKELRRSKSLIPKLDHDTHKELHDQVIYVPPPDQFFGQAIIGAYEPVYDDRIKSVENLMRAISEVRGQPRRHELDKRLGEIMIYAIEAQIPFIRDSLAKTDEAP